MPESYIQLPADSTGKKVRTRQRTVGANTIEEQYVISQNERIFTGIYVAHTGAHTVQGTTAHASTGLAGFWWLSNPVGSSVLVALRRVEFMSQLGSALSTPTSPRIVLERLAFTGTNTGTVITAAKRATSDATQVARLSSTFNATVTGSAVGAQVFAFLPIASATGVGYTAATAADWNPDDDGQVVLAAGEAIICRQPDAGTSSDTRRFVTNIAWSEYTIP